MNWKKNVYDNLTTCATLCDETATVLSRATDIENWYQCIFLNLDCADICRQVAMLYVRDSANMRLLAQTCIDVCSKCADEAEKFENDNCHHTYVACKQAIASCVTILGMMEHSKQVSPSWFAGPDFRETLYN